MVFTCVETEYNFKTGELNVVSERAFSDGERALVKCYGADDVFGRRSNYETRGCRCFHHR